MNIFLVNLAILSLFRKKFPKILREVTLEKLELIGACRCYIKVPSKIKISILPQILLEMIENKNLLKITVLEFKEIYSMTV